ncbi:MAG: cysteine hydrolase [Bdellovibrionales bacterium]|nr:cysteine hydrolase [Bdellovibrionales bacterium]
MNSAALILVDVQKGFDFPVWGERNNADAEERISTLLGKWRKDGHPVIHIQHSSKEVDSPLSPDSSGFDFKPEAMPRAGEPIFVKHVNSAFIGTALEKYLRDSEISDLVFVGLTTNHCVSTSCRMAANLGFNVWVVSDATATFAREGFDGQLYSAQQIHDISLANLHGEFAQVVTTSDLVD